MINNHDCLFQKLLSDIDMLCTLRTFCARFCLCKPEILQSHQILGLPLLVLHVQILKIVTLG